jgi:hypothetical protein
MPFYSKDVALELRKGSMRVTDSSTLGGLVYVAKTIKLEC